MHPDPLPAGYGRLLHPVVPAGHRAPGPTELRLVDRLHAGVDLVLPGHEPDHHGGPAAERHLRGVLHDAAAVADS